MARTSVLGLVIKIVVVGAMLVALASCAGFAWVIDPFERVDEFTPSVLEAQLARLGRAAEVEFVLEKDTIPGFTPALRSLRGYTNGAVYVTSLELPESNRGNDPVRREFALFERLSPLLFSVEPGGLISYTYSLVDSVTYAPRTDEYGTPDRTYVGLVTLRVDAEPDVRRIGRSQDVLNFRAATPLKRNGLAINIVTVPKATEDRINSGDGDLYSFDDPRFWDGYTVAMTLVHPGLDRLPGRIDDYFVEPAELLVPPTSPSERASETRLYEPLELTTIRNETALIRRVGYDVGRRTIYEGYSSGEHNVYVAMVTNTTGAVISGGRMVAGNSGDVGMALIVFDSEESILSALEGSTDQFGFDIVTGLNESGFRADGTGEGGRFFSGLVDANGRQGFGTTFFEDGRSISGNYVEDALVGVGLEVASDGTRFYGVFDGASRKGEFVRVAPTGATDIALFDGDVEQGSRPYAPSRESGTWIWIDDALPSAPFAAVRADLGAAVVPLGNDRYEVNGIDGSTYVGGFPDDTRRSGTITYADGRSYVGELVAAVPDGEGSMEFRDGSKLVGGFSGGQPDGRLLLSTDEQVVSVEYFEGRQVDAPVQASTPEAPSIVNFVFDSTSGYVDYVRAYEEGRRAERQEFWNNAASVAFDLIEVTAGALETYNQQLSAQQVATPSYGLPSGPTATGARGPYWSTRGGRPPVGADDVQLATLVAAADRYYDNYLLAIQADDAARATQLYNLHIASVRQAWSLVDQARGSQATFNVDQPYSPGFVQTLENTTNSFGGTNPCLDYDGPGECAQEQ